MKEEYPQQWMLWKISHVQSWCLGVACWSLRKQFQLSRMGRCQAIHGEKVVGNKKKGEKKYRLSLKPLATRLGEKIDYWRGEGGN